MFSNLQTKVNLALAGHAHYIFLVMVGIAAAFMFLRSLRAWRDIAKLDQQQWRDKGQELVKPLSDRFAPKDELAVRQLRSMLIQAGLRDDNAVTKYIGLRVTSLVVGGACTFLFLAVGFDAMHTVLMGGVTFFAGYAYPDFSLRSRIEARQAKLSRALPSVVDLMVLCLDVGLSLEAAFERVTYEIRDLEPLMADEASLMLSEMGAGVTFPQGLKRMADRIGLEDLSTLSRLISQASLMGASIAQTLRDYSDQAFQKRMVSLEEKAGKITSMMVLPVTLCMLPAAMIALVGPAVLMLVKMIARS